ncbi:DUF6093 family protein [Paeniglutamicibacter gangotriensis]|nr:DUF6093 family protein [Paeniglutamicibacter gangotriensis]
MAPLGLPNMRVIPDGWAEAHRPVVAQTMTAMCTIKRIQEGPAPYPLPDGWSNEVIVWSGMCRLQELKRETSPLVADQPTELRQYLIALPFENGAGVPLPRLFTGERGDLVETTGRVFNLKQSMAGSLLWENDFIAYENQTQQQP